MNDIENVLRRVSEESNRYLKSVNALDLMHDAVSLQKDIHNAIKRYKLPVIIIAGVLASEIHGVLSEVDSIHMENAVVEMLQKRDKDIKSDMDKNFMRKESL